MENREGSGVLFVNNKKEKETHPDYTGKIVVNGVEKRLAAWKRDNGRTKYLSIQMSDFGGGSGSNVPTASSGPSIPREAVPSTPQSNDPF